MKINFFEHGKIEIDGIVYTNDLIISPEKVIKDWRRKKGHRLLKEDIERYKEMILNSGYLLCGCGTSKNVKLDKEFLEWVKVNDLIFFHGETGSITKLYNEAVERGHKPIALLHLTC